MNFIVGLSFKPRNGLYSFLKKFFLDTFTKLLCNQNHIKDPILNESLIKIKEFKVDFFFLKPTEG
jgi:hypothetical protein